MQLLPLLALLGWFLSAGPNAQAATNQAPADATRAPVLDQRRLRQAMSRLASEHSEIVSLLNVGESRKGSKIEALRVAAGTIGKGRPAILLVANIDGPLVYTSAIAFGHAQALVAGYGKDERITQLLDSTTVYVIPRANPDAAEGYFASPRHEALATGHGVDNDRDGRNGEDGPEDVNGDGLVSTMRVPDPDGTWTEDPTEPRATIEAERGKGQRGLWKLVPEGRDHDADGEASEDPLLDAIVNRNFAQDWSEHGPSAGLFPTDEPEVRGLCEFVLGRKDIQLVIVYGELHNMGGKLESVKDDAPAKMRVPPTGLRASDAALLEELGRRYIAVTKNEPAGGTDRAGTFQAWCYGQRGLFCLEIAPWTMPLDSKGPAAEAATEAEEEPAGATSPGAASPGQTSPGETPAAPRPDDKKPSKEDPEPSQDAKRLKWIDEQGEGWRHLGWTPYEHPELGPVQIGGFAPFGRTDPTEAKRLEIAEREFEFLLAVSSQLAHVTIEDATARSLGGGLLEVKARVENTGLLPLLTTWGQETRATRPALVEIHLPKGAELLAGDRKQRLADVAGSGGSAELRWLVRGANAAAIGIHVETDHAGEARAIPEVQR